MLAGAGGAVDLLAPWRREIELNLLINQVTERYEQYYRE